MHIDVDQLWLHAQRHIHQVGKVALWLVYGISRVYDPLYLIRFH